MYLDYLLSLEKLERVIAFLITILLILLIAYSQEIISKIKIKHKKKGGKNK